MQREQAVSLIARLGDAVGMSLALDESGMCMLALDDNTAISIGHDLTSERLVLFAPLDAVVPTERALRWLLSANFLWQATGGATLALTPGGDAAILQQALPDDIDVPGLQAAFTAFADQAVYWNRESPVSEEDAATSGAPDFGSDSHMIKG